MGSEPFVEGRRLQLFSPRLDGWTGKRIQITELMQKDAGVILISTTLRKRLQKTEAANEK